MKLLCIEIYGGCYQKCMGGYIVSQEIERGDIIIYESGIHKAIVVSARASKCFFFIHRSEKIVLINSDIAI